MAQGDYLYFFDPDDSINPAALEIAYNAALETNADAVQFNFQTIRFPEGIIYEGHNGNKAPGIYDKEEIVKEYLPRFIGYSVHDIQNFGKWELVEKEMGAVWRFLYKRSTIVDNGVLFPVDVRLNEDSLFNCRFFCFATRIVYLGDSLYTYCSKDNGAMISSLRNLDVLFLNKFAAKNERMKLRRLYLEKHDVDIFPLFAGSLFLSAVEMAVKSNGFWKNLKRFLAYAEAPDVMEAVSIIPFKGNLKIKVLLFLFKMRWLPLVYFATFFAKKLGMKRW